MVHGIAHVAAWATDTSLDEVLDWKNPYEQPEIETFGEHDLARYLLEFNLLLGCGFNLELDEEARYNLLSPDATFQASVALHGIQAYLIAKHRDWPGHLQALYWSGEMVYDPHPQAKHGRSLATYPLTALFPISPLVATKFVPVLRRIK